MINWLKLKNFRNFKDKKIDFYWEKTFIIWENWKWKTNILEALSLLTNNSIIQIEFEKMVLKWEKSFFIEYEDWIWNNLWISFDKDLKKKNYIINWKKVSKSKLMENSSKSVIFSPIVMNLMYLSPSLRRNFLDQILINSFPEYSKKIEQYKKILKNRNIVLKNIRERKCGKEEINFWDNSFINISFEIYNYRFKIIEFFQDNIWTCCEYFWEKVKNVKFIYETKIEKDNIKEIIKNYLEKNIDRDIIIWKTVIWPHLDDFNILLDEVKLTDFASRWETKSVILWLKLLETIFIEKYTNKKPILLIDDLLSELDENHKKILLNEIKDYQTFITGIALILDNLEETNIIKL